MGDGRLFFPKSPRPNRKIFFPGEFKGPGAKKTANGILNQKKMGFKHRQEKKKIKRFLFVVGV